MQYLKTLGVLEVSELSQYRVSVANIDKNRYNHISLQLWWRNSTEDEWNPGKGFCVGSNVAFRIMNALLGATDTIEYYEKEVDVTDSQKFIVFKDLEKDIVVIEKRWHRGDYDWNKGKSIAFSTEHARSAAIYMQNGSLY